MTTESLTRKLLGYVDVDSGTLLVGDPCYFIPEKDEQYTDTTLGRASIFYDNLPHPWTKTKQDYRAHKLNVDSYQTIEEFRKDYEKAVREDHENPLWIEVSQAQHRVNNQTAVILGSFGGDGTYPVYGFYDKEGRLNKTEIIFNCEEE